MRIALPLALVLAAGPAVAADQFDLVCKGAKEAFRPKSTTPDARRYRIDLAAKLWCMDECTRAETIKEVTPTTLILDRSTPEDRDGEHMHSISRLDGTYFSMLSIRSILVLDTTKGVCELAEFSGFPKAKF